MIAAAAAALVLTGCGEAQDPAEEADTSLPSAASAPAPGQETAADADNPFADAAGETEAGPPAPACPDEAGLTCAGQLRIAAVDTTVSRDRNAFLVRGSLRFTNAGAEPVEVALVEAEPTLRLDNGAAFGGSAYRVFSSETCSRNNTPDECYAKTPEKFFLLERGDSPREINFSFRNNSVETGLIPSMPDVDAATLNLTLTTVAPSGAKRQRELSVNSIPVTARVGG
ncbi:hypothetical protein [Qipengyuania sp. MTN3-11]|uniref:hypothetical protein n=1 Tax=Qipengyuania sp. MTN3-11 TaxID=3056557 RepID=UPI0036F2E5EB